MPQASRKSLLGDLMPKDSGPTWRDNVNDWLHGLEIKGATSLGVKGVLDWAANRPAELGYKRDDKGEGDAMRHLLLSAELHRTHPWIADALLYGHEYGTNVLQGQSADDRHQDVFNNRLGKEIGRKAMSREDVERLAKDALKKGAIVQ